MPLSPAFFVAFFDTDEYDTNVHYQEPAVTRRNPRMSLPQPAQSPAASQRRRSEPKSLALLVDIVLARYGILPLQAAETMPAQSPSLPRRGEQTLLFPVS
jgi:hypothetical protein